MISLLDPAFAADDRFGASEECLEHLGTFGSAWEHLGLDPKSWERLNPKLEGAPENVQNEHSERRAEAFSSRA